MSHTLLSIHTWFSEDETTITLIGECDLSNVAELNIAVAEALLFEKRRLIIDVEELRFMGTCGLMPIARADECLKPIHGVVLIQGASGMLKWLLDLFGMFQLAVAA